MEIIEGGKEIDQFDVIIDTTGGGGGGAAPNSERQSNQRLIVSACEILQLPRFDTDAIDSQSSQK